MTHDGKHADISSKLIPVIGKIMEVRVLKSPTSSQFGLKFQQNN